MMCAMRTCVTILALLGCALAQYNPPYSEEQLRDLPNRYGNAFFETVNPVGTAVLLQNTRTAPGFDLPYQTEWLTIYDTPASTIAPQSCGNGIREGYEICDLFASWANNPLCLALGFNPIAPGGQVACGADCTWDHSGVASWTCASGLGGGTTGFCGNGVIDAFEQCDIDPTTHIVNTGGLTCASLGLGFTAGNLGCRFTQGATPLLTCAFDFSDCTRSTPGCGDGIIEGVEQCDPPGQILLAGCTAIGLLPGIAAGNPVCSPTCDWDVGYCLPYGNQLSASCEAALPGGTPKSCPLLCGDNIIEVTEQCDGTNLQGQTCASLGYAGGNLNCSGCRYDVRGCTAQGGLVTVAAIGANVTEVAVGDVVALSPTASCISFSLNSDIENRNAYCLVDQSAIAVTLQEGNLFFDKSDISNQAGFRNSIPISGDLGTQTNF